MEKQKQDGATIREVYTLVTEMRTELIDSITRLETKFDTLEAGRLSALESDFNKTKVELLGAVKTLRIEMEPTKRLVYGVVTLMLTALVAAIIAGVTIMP